MLVFSVLKERFRIIPLKQFFDINSLNKHVLLFSSVSSCIIFWTCFSIRINYVAISNTAWKVSKYGVFSGPYFPVFGLNMEICGVNYYNRIQSEYRKIWTRRNSVFGNFSRSENLGSFSFTRHRNFHNLMKPFFGSFAFKLLIILIVSKIQWSNQIESLQGTTSMVWL